MKSRLLLSRSGRSLSWCGLLHISALVIIAPPRLGLVILQVVRRRGSAVSIRVFYDMGLSRSYQIQQVHHC